MRTYEHVSDCPGYDEWKLDPGYSDVDDDAEERDEMVLDCGLENCCMPGEHLRSECHTPEMIEAMEAECSPIGEQAIFEFLCRKYVQRSDARQKSMGLQYTEAETHDLAREMSAFIASQGR